MPKLQCRGHNLDPLKQLTKFGSASVIALGWNSHPVLRKTWERCEVYLGNALDKNKQTNKQTIHQTCYCGVVLEALYEQVAGSNTKCGSNSSSWVVVVVVWVYARVRACARNLLWCNEKLPRHRLQRQSELHRFDLLFVLIRGTIRWYSGRFSRLSMKQSMNAEPVCRVCKWFLLGVSNYADEGV